jgi:hypothetical protein
MCRGNVAFWRLVSSPPATRPESSSAIPLPELGRQDAALRKRSDCARAPARRTLHVRAKDGTGSQTAAASAGEQSAVSKRNLPWGVIPLTFALAQTEVQLLQSTAFPMVCLAVLFLILHSLSLARDCPSSLDHGTSGASKRHIFNRKRLRGAAQCAELPRIAVSTRRSECGERTDQE